MPDSLFVPFSEIRAEAWKGVRERWVGDLASTVGLSLFTLPLQWVAYGADERAWDRVTGSGWWVPFVAIIAWVLLLGAWHLYRAPVRMLARERAERGERQADEAELDPARFAEEFAAFVAATEASYPSSLGIMTTLTMANMSKEDRARVRHSERQRNDDARRASLAAYHDKFARSAVRLLRQPGHEAFAEAYEQVAREPQGSADLQTLNEVFAHLADPSSDLEPGGTDAERRELTDELEALASDMGAWLAERETEQALDRVSAEGRATDDRDEARREAARQRQLEAAFYLRFQDDALRLFDWAVTLRCADPTRRPRVAAGPDNLRSIPLELRAIALRLRHALG